MSKLLGPLSVTKSNVSWRDCALAGENTAGADTMLAPASAAVDLRKSRRFMEASRCPFGAFGGYALKGHARIRTAPVILHKPLIPMRLSEVPKSVVAVRHNRLHTTRACCLNLRQIAPT